MSPAYTQRLQLLLVAFAATLPYLPILGAGFIGMDDPYFITVQPWWHEPTWSAVFDAFSRPIFGSYHPLHQVSYIFDRWLWGPTPFGVRLTQTLLHAGCAVTVVTVARRLALPWGGALLAGLVFAWHPAHAENVAWVSQRKDMVSTCFALLALCVYLGPIPHGLRTPSPPPSWSRTLAACGLLTLAALGKSVAVVVIPWLVTLSWLRGDLRREWTRFLPMAVIGALAVLAHYSAQKAWGGAMPAPPPLRHAQRVLRALAYYLQTAVAPVGLSPSPPAPGLAFGAKDALALVTVVGTGTLAALSWRRGRRFALLLTWFGVALLPTLGVIPFPTFVQDRYLLLPSVPLALGVGWAGAGWLRPSAPRRRRLQLGVLGLILVVGCTATTRYAWAWGDGIRLWTWNLQQHPGTADARERLASATLDLYRAEQDPLEHARLRLEVERLCLATVAADPGRLSANLHLAELREEEGRFDEARLRLRAGLEGASNWRYRAGVRLCLLELREDHLGEASAALSRAAELAPAHAPEVDAAGGALALAEGDLLEAARRFRAATKALPEWKAAWANLALVYRLQGQRKSSDVNLTRAQPSPLAAAVAAHSALDSGTLDGARANLAEAGSSPEAALVRARLAVFEGDEEAARAALGEYLARAGPGGRHRAALEWDLRPLLEASGE